MKILPIRNLKLTMINSEPNNQYGIFVESTKNIENSKILLGELKEGADPEVLNDLINKYAYASALLYFVENFNLKDDINKEDLLEDIDILLHNRCKVVEEKAPLLTKIGNYPLYEGTNYILRGEGNKKIKESFNLSEDIDIKDITRDYLDNAKYDKIIKGFIRCPQCNNVYEEWVLDTEYENYPDDYTGPIDNEPISYRCPYCNYRTSKEENFASAWLSDLYDAPNKEEILREYCSDGLNEEIGTQASDIASKVDYSFQSVPTPANPKKKIKLQYESFNLSDLDDEDTLNVVGFIRDVDGFYKRGNYVLVKENETFKVINKNKLYEEEEPTNNIEDKNNFFNKIENKINNLFPGRFKLTPDKKGDYNTLVITDTTSTEASDLVEVTEAISTIMKDLQYNQNDYDLDIKNNNLVLIVKDSLQK